MADNTTLNPGTGGDVIATDDVAGVKYQIVKLDMGGNGESLPLSASNPMPIAGTLSVDNFPAQTGLTDAQLRAAAVPVEDASAGGLLWRILQVLLSPLGYDKSLQRYRQTAVIESGTVTTVSTVTVVGTVNGLPSIGGIQAQILVNGQNISAWQSSVRSRIT